VDEARSLPKKGLMVSVLVLRVAFYLLFC